MKGIVFTEFLELVEEQYGIATVQKIIDECDLETGGVYTSVGTYNHGEMFQMVKKLSEIKDVPVPDLLKGYGEFFFTVLSKSYPKFMEQSSLFDFLESIDGYIHPEVLKLYPDAELPRFSASVKEDHMELIYESTRKMSDFAIGLIKGAATYFKTPVSVDIAGTENEGKRVILKISEV